MTWSHSPATERYTTFIMFNEPQSLKSHAEAQAFPITDLLRSIWRRLWIVVLMTLLALGAAIGFGLAQTPEYETSIKLLIGQEQDSDAPGNLGSDVQGLQQITQTMTEAVGTRPVAQEVIQRLGLDVTPEQFLEENLTVEQVGATQFIQVNYRDTDPQRAQQVANVVGDVFSERVSNVSTGNSAVNVTVWERAAVPEAPVSPNIRLYAAAALALGLMLGVSLALLLEYLDDSWRSPEEVEEVSGVPNFGVIPQFRVLRARALKKIKKGG